MSLPTYTKEQQDSDRETVLAMFEQRAILYGLPVIVDGDACTPANWLSGILLDFMVTCFGFNGWIKPYAEGEGYWRTLWRWVTEDDDDD